jgi:PAS domain S-box-containing protein
MPLLAHVLICASIAALAAAAAWKLAARREERRVGAREELYAALVENLPGAVALVFDTDLRIGSVKGDLARFGYRADQLLGRTLGEVAPTRMAELRPRYGAALAGEAQQFDWAATVGAHPVEVRLVPLHDHRGRVDGVMSLTQDVSAARHAELAVRASEERYRKLLQALPGTTVATFDEDLVYTFVGGTGLEHLDLPEGGLIGRNVYDHLPPETADSIAENFRASLSGVPRSFDYTSIAGDRSYRMHTVPLHDDGGIAGGLVVMQDTTDHRKAEARLGESERRLREIFGSLQEGIAVHDASGLVVSRNASADRILGTNDGGFPMIGDPTWHAVDDEGRRLEEHELPVMEALRSGERVARVVGFVPAAGATRWISTNCVPLFREGDTEPYAAVVSFTDVTAAREAERLKDEFFTLISHELRTPLTSIAGYTEMLLDEDEEEQLSETQRRFAEVIDRNAGRLQRLITDLLFVAQLEAGRLSFDVARVDLDTVVRQAVDSARSHAGDMAIELDADIAAAATRGDFDRLGQVIDNLISNAIKFTPHGGRVTVELDVDDAHAVVSVHDSGIGIPEPELGDLFAKFVRASTAREREIPGVGIGLSICKAIVEGHGGTIHIESALGSGTTVTVRLPAVIPVENATDGVVTAPQGVSLTP